MSCHLSVTMCHCEVYLTVNGCIELPIVSSITASFHFWCLKSLYIESVKMNLRSESQIATSQSNNHDVNVSSEEGPFPTSNVSNGGGTHNGGGENGESDCPMMESKTEVEVTVTEIQMQILERLSKLSAVAVKSQQRDEPDLAPEQKLDYLKSILCSQPEHFLSRFGRFLQANELSCFDDLRRKGGYGVTFHLDEIAKFFDKGSTEKRLKNRRYEALKKLVETTDYFSEEEMQRRNPILFEQLIGKYHTDEEREAFLQQSWKSTSGSGTTSMPLTDLFLAHLERTATGEGCRRLEQQCVQDEEDEAEAEYDTELEDEEADSITSKSPHKPTVNDEDGPREEIDDDEKELLKEEFFTTMYRNFLNGKDTDFDYSTVDDNPEYDLGENLENDQEDKYFDEEEPCEISDPCSSDADDLFKPPVRSSDIESKIKTLSVNNENSTTSSKPMADSLMASDDDEDPLDAYMRELEKQL